MIEFANRINEIHRQRKFDCVNYDCCGDSDKKCAIVIGTPPALKAYYAPCEIEICGHCDFFKRGKNV